MTVEVAPLDVTELAEAMEFDIECDYAALHRENPQWYPWHHGPARWIMRLSCEDCHMSKSKLVCETCKDNLLVTTNAAWCIGERHIVVPWGAAIRAIEPLRP